MNFHTTAQPCIKFSEAKSDPTSRPGSTSLLLSRQTEDFMVPVESWGGKPMLATVLHGNSL